MTEEYVVADLGAAAGRIVWWTLQGVVDHDALVDRLAKLPDLDKLERPALPSERTLLRRAMLAYGEPEFDGPLKVDTVHGGPFDGYLALLVREDEGEKPRYVTAFVARLEDGHLDEDGDVDRDALYAKIEEARIKLLPEDVSKWLTSSVVPFLAGVTLRDRGSIYFIPDSTVDYWHAITQCLPGQQFYEVRAYTKDSAIRAVIEAVHRESEELAKKIVSTLEGRKTAKGLRGHYNNLRDMLNKIEEYERLLGCSFEETKKLCEEARNELVETMIAFDVEVE